MPEAKDANGIWQKLFMALMAVIFTVLAGSYVKLATDVAKNTIVATKALDATVTIGRRLDAIDSAERAAAAAERAELQAKVLELQQQLGGGE